MDPVTVTKAPGETLSVSADVANVGEVSGDAEVAFTLNGDAVATQTVPLDAGEITQVTFEVAVPDQTGEYVHAVETDGSIADGTLIVDGSEGNATSVTVVQEPDTRYTASD
ncbi:hypothetical protein BRD13_08050 [Halobacteriales archaeon SW_5_70_135]|nr:MAG: hypothetical protein BRD13_08050 [Halobacteriales archaeon SW_5_70_135]